MAESTAGASAPNALAARVPLAFPLGDLVLVHCAASLGKRLIAAQCSQRPATTTA